MKSHVSFRFLGAVGVLAASTVLISCVDANVPPQPPVYSGSELTVPTLGSRPEAPMAAPQTEEDSESGAVTLTGLVMAPEGVTRPAQDFLGMGYRVPTEESRKVLALTGNPLAGVQMMIAKADGKFNFSYPLGRSDASGRYSFEYVPAGTMHLVVAMVQPPEGGYGLMQTLAFATSKGGDANISAASTLVSQTVVTGQTDFPPIKPELYHKAVEAVAANMTAQDMPNWPDRASWKGTLVALAKRSAVVKEAMNALMADVPLPY